MAGRERSRRRARTPCTACVGWEILLARRASKLLAALQSASTLDAAGELHGTDTPKPQHDNPEELSDQ